MAKIFKGLLLTGTAYLIAAAIVIGLALLILWGVWHLWTFVVPQFFPTGTPILIHPDYWTFCAAWILIGLIGRRIFGRKSN